MKTTDIIERDTNTPGFAHFLHLLDDKSRAILWYLWWHRHASLSELKSIGNATNDYEVLYRLKEVINQKSHDLWGKPVVSFEQSRIDSFTGEKILFSWWFLDTEEIRNSDTSGRLVDVFDEKDDVTIFVQLPSLFKYSAPEIQFNKGILKIKFAKHGFDNKLES